MCKENKLKFEMHVTWIIKNVYSFRKFNVDICGKKTA
jgi:hypothetical protein